MEQSECSITEEFCEILISQVSRKFSLESRIVRRELEKKIGLPLGACDDPKLSKASRLLTHWLDFGSLD